MMHNGSSSSSTSQTQSNDIPIATSVPNELKRLIRIIMKAFYNFESYLCMEMLLIYPCIKVDDLAELLRLDQKVVNNYLNLLKKEKFLNEKIIMETSASDGKQAKCNYFYINYKMLVNVIKYKLDKIRIQIESEEKQFTTRANFKCTSCSKTYSDLDTKDIFLTMRCLYCGSDVDEDTSTLPKQSANLMSKFNSQTTILSDLLRQVEHIRLADNILRPDPFDMTDVLERMNPNQNGSANGSRSNGSQATGRSAMTKFDKWSGDKTRNTDLLGQTRITINFDSSNSSNQAQKEKKELPSILLLNRMPEEDPNNRDSQLLNSVKQAADETLQNSSNSSLNKNTLSDTTNLTNSSLNTNNLSKPNLNTNQSMSSNGSSSINNQTGNLEMIIMQKLLKYEKKAYNESSSASSSAASANSDSSIQISTTTINNLANNTITTTSSLNNSSSTSSISLIKKRPIDSSEYKNGHSQFNHINDFNYKKRKLNNGDIVEDSIHKSNGYTKNGFHSAANCLKRNHSDGSENSDEYDEDYEDEIDYYLQQQNDSYINHGSNPASNLDSPDDMFIPKVYVKSRLIRFDRITPKLINLMNDLEKENYINICRQLYTEIYEI